MSAVTDPTGAVASRWVTDDLTRIFEAEIANERHGGVAPATLSSTIDSISQGLPFAEGSDPAPVMNALLVIRDLLPGDTEVRDLI